MASVQLMSNSNELKENVAHTITIESNPGSTALSLSGLLQNGISIAYKPGYEDLADLVPLGPQIKSVAAEIGKRTGAQVLNGMAEQKYYTGAAPVTINAVIKVNDNDGTGKPLEIAAKIASFCQPSAALNDLTKAFLDFDIKAITNESKKVGTELLTKAQDLNEAGTAKGQNFNDAVKTLGRTVNVRISDFLHFPHMIIDSASQEFSFEQGLNGPISATFTLSLTTLRVPDAAQVVSFYKKPGTTNSRIKYTGG